MIKHWVVVLGLSRLPVPLKVEKARFIVSAMASNANFSTPVPPLATIKLAAAALETAYIDSREGSKAKTAEMRVKEQELDLLLIELGHYIADTANKNQDNAEAIILSAGVNAKNVPVHTARNFEVKNSEMPGKVTMRTKYVNRASFIWQYSPNLVTVGSWTTANITVKASSEISELISGNKYYFRVAVVTKNGQGPWSDELTLIVM